MPPSVMSFGASLRDLFDRALTAPNGVMLEMELKKAKNLRFRLYYMRSAEKKAMAKSTGTTPDRVVHPWDKLTVSVEKVGPDTAKVIVRQGDVDLDGIVLRDPETGEPL